MAGPLHKRLTLAALFLIGSSFASASHAYTLSGYKWGDSTPGTGASVT